MLISNNEFNFDIYKRDEKGTITLLILLLFILLLIGFGAAIDFARYEHERSRLQFALDNATLAAASIRSFDQNGEIIAPDVILQNYMNASGVGKKQGYDPIINVDTTSVDLIERNIEANISNRQTTFFLRLAGVDELVASVRSQAYERDAKTLELAIVLDISTSMRRKGDNGIRYIEALREAVKSFIRSLNVENENKKIVVSIIPFGGPVTVTQELWDALGGNKVTDSSLCAQFNSNSYNVRGLAQGDLPLQQYLRHSRAGNINDNKFFTCTNEQISTSNRILPWSHSETDLLQAVDNLKAHSGGTGQHFGMKWAHILLDDSPAVRNAYASLTDDTESILPTSWNDNKSDKIVVIMTDGEPEMVTTITDEFRDKTHHKFFRTNGINNNNNVTFDWKKLDNGKYVKLYSNANQEFDAADLTYADTLRPLTYPELFATYSMWVLMPQYRGPNYETGESIYRKNADATYALITNHGEVIKSFYSADDVRRSFLDSCQAMRGSEANGEVRIFTLNLGPSVTDNFMAECAGAAEGESTHERSYRVESSNLEEAFASITTSISKLRLIQ